MKIKINEFKRNTQTHIATETEHATHSTVCILESQHQQCLRTHYSCTHTTSIEPHSIPVLFRVFTIFAVLFRFVLFVLVLWLLLREITIDFSPLQYSTQEHSSIKKRNEKKADDVEVEMKTRTQKMQIEWWCPANIYLPLIEAKFIINWTKRMKNVRERCCFCSTFLYVRSNLLCRFSSIQFWFGSVRCCFLRNESLMSRNIEIDVRSVFTISFLQFFRSLGLWLFNNAISFYIFLLENNNSSPILSLKLLNIYLLPSRRPHSTTDVWCARRFRRRLLLRSWFVWCNACIYHLVRSWDTNRPMHCARCSLSMRSGFTFSRSLSLIRLHLCLPMVYSICK